MLKSVYLLLTTTWLASCLPPPHPKVVAVRQEEEYLPQHLRSRALHNPHLREILPLTSLLHSGEQIVYDRESDKVPRRQIYNLLTHSGLVPRQRFQKIHQPLFHQQIHRPPHFHDPPFYPSPELLQHL
ncbi:uncharacterized protein [Choristoneura fumiferana]|uniref:uncharacterized protein n=1 Tax=Choristoneura fumiferana TaxID=7141 RepID=UPI003D15E592